jgi:hypothetical protein
MAAMKVPFTGGCSCGAIRYECTAEPIMMLKCHCRDCQQLTGGGFIPAVLVPAKSFRLTRGQLRYHFTPSIPGGKHKRGFCPECGSRITGAESEAGDSPFVGVLAGTLRFACVVARSRRRRSFTESRLVRSEWRILLKFRNRGIHLVPWLRVGNENVHLGLEPSRIDTKISEMSFSFIHAIRMFGGINKKRPAVGNLVYE